VWDDADRKRLTAVLESRAWAFDGPMERAFERAFAARHGALDAACVSNGSVTLLLCLRALGVKPGDEIIVPALTWTATATAAIEANAVPVIVDVDPATLCMDPAAVRAAITPRTIAIVPVHLYSSMADMDAIMDIAGGHGLAVIEDCAHAHGAAWRGRGAGSVGSLGSWSFQLSKVMTAGEGGAVTSRDKALLDRVYSGKNCGRVRPDRGAPIFGTNHRLSEWQAAILIGQLERLDAHVARRNAAWKKLAELLRPFECLRLVADQEGVTQRPCYRVVIHYDRAAAHGIPLESFVEAVHAEGVPVERTYPALYDNLLYNVADVSWYPRKLEPQRCPNAEAAAYESAFALCQEVLLGPDEDLLDVVKAFEKVLAHPGEAADLGSRARSTVKAFIRRFR
jgi:dTDP-4-amino-4,6-dideoxygalactose transaminase